MTPVNQDRRESEPIAGTVGRVETGRPATEWDVSSAVASVPGPSLGLSLGRRGPPLRLRSIPLAGGAGAVAGGFGAKDNGLLLKAIPDADLDALGRLINPGEAALVVWRGVGPARDRARCTHTASGRVSRPGPARTPTSRARS